MTSLAGERMKKNGFIVYKIKKLAILLRIMGFDVFYIPEGDYHSVINLAREKHRIIISRVKLLRKIPWIFYLRSDHLDEQLKEVIKGLNLQIEKDSLFTRCSACNSLLKEISEEKVKDEVPSTVRGKGYWFKKCKGCGKLYWNGNHLITLKEKFAHLNIEY